MITHWNEICNQIEVSDEILNKFIDGAGLSVTQLKKLNKFVCEWNRVKKLADAFDQFISPVDPIKVESPFDQEDFRYIWKTWKEYLQEQHGQLIRSRAEQMSLDYLAEISDCNPDTAIFFLRFAMANRYKNFFKVDKKDIDKPTKTNDSDF